MDKIVEQCGQTLAAAIRGAETENVHSGHIAVVDADGRLFAHVGDADVPSFMRSTAKPVQVLPVLFAGVMEAYRLPEAAIAMMTASHRGEQAHAEMLETMLQLTGVKEEELVFHAGLPINADARDAYIRSGGKPRKLFHNCAGKHIGLLAACRLQGWPTEGYAEPGHPIQQSIKRWIAELAEMPESELIGGFDGCGLPVYAIPIHRLALLYAKLAAPPAGMEEQKRSAIQRIASSMNAHPELVEGTGRLASLLLSGGSAVAKSGAQGVFGLGLRKERLGIAIKISDGTESAWPAIVAHTLRQLAQLGRVDSHDAEAIIVQIEAAFPAVMHNDAGRVIGRREAVFKLKEI